MRLSIILFGLNQMLKHTARKYPWFKNRLKEKNLTVQMKVADDSEGRYFAFTDGKIISKSGIHPHPDVCMTFGSAALAVKLLTHPEDHLSRINAIKNFQLGLEGPDELSW